MPTSRPAEHRVRISKPLWIAITAVVWLAATWLFWVGYTGEDDLFYARYAYLLHRPPIIWWEFRIPAVLAIRAAFGVFGPSEFAAALPSLLASLAILASVAWFVEWPARLTWQSQSAVLLAAIVPIDVTFRSYPSAPQIAAGLLALGTVSLIKGNGRTAALGAVLLAIAFLTHEVSFFYIAFLCLTAVCIDRRFFMRRVVWVVALSGLCFAVECLVYAVLLGDPLARLHTSESSLVTLGELFDPDTGLREFSFLVWPLKNLIFSKQFGFDIVLLLGAGVVAWPRLDRDQRVLLCTTFAVYFWLGYGSLVPWTYKPLYRQYHYYNSLTLGFAALLPGALGHAFASRPQRARAFALFALLVHAVSLGGGARWGARVDVARELLAYADAHPSEQFVTDVNSLNEMYVLNGFRLPRNVSCVNGEAVRLHLLLNKEPPSVPRYRCPDVPVDAILVNREQQAVHGFEKKFAAYLAAHQGSRSVVEPVKYRLAFVPLLPFVDAREFMVRSAGGDAVTIAEQGRSVSNTWTQP